MPHKSIPNPTLSKHPATMSFIQGTMLLPSQMKSEY
jgi:hypothetical protein